MSSENEDLVDSILEESIPDSQLQFMVILKKYPVLLNKSQVPIIKARKEQAVKDAIKEINSTLALGLDEKSLMKKVSRMKGSVRTKCDATKTGNKRIGLVSWEKLMYDLIHADSNPTIMKTPVSFKIF
jgi:hypothetical protein